MRKSRGVDPCTLWRIADADEAAPVGVEAGPGLDGAVDAKFVEVGKQKQRPSERGFEKRRVLVRRRVGHRLRQGPENPGGRVGRGHEG